MAGRTVVKVARASHHAGMTTLTLAIAAPGATLGRGQEGTPEGGREVGDGVAAVGEAQGHADERVEGALELAVGHAWGAEGDAAHVRVGELDRRPGRACMHSA